jgi:hypothetical protein
VIQIGPYVPRTGFPAGLDWARLPVEVSVMTNSPRPVELLHRLADVDRQIWHGGGVTTISLRDQAARAAVAAGWSLQEIADHVGVLASDVEGWTATPYG